MCNKDKSKWSIIIYIICLDDTKNTKKDATLFSIHCLQIDEVCFIYEAEIDAIQHSKDEEGVNDVVSIYEIKTNSYKEEIQNIFKEYYECSKTQTLSHDQMKRYNTSRNIYFFKLHN